MVNQLLPDPDLAPSVPEGLTPEQRIALWVDLMEACDQFLFAGLRREVGPDGDVYAAYRGTALSQKALTPSRQLEQGATEGA